MARYRVGQRAAVEMLVAKLRGRGADTPGSRRLARAITRAQTRYQRVGTPDDQGFFHGLLTGYAVARLALEGKLNRSNTAQR